MADAIPVSKKQPEPKQPEAKQEKKPEPKGYPVGTHDAVRVDH